MTAISLSAPLESVPGLAHPVPGRGLHAQLPKGSVLVAVEGALRLEIAITSDGWLTAMIPAWLAGAFRLRSVRLDEGERHRLEQAAWVSVFPAESGAAACAVMPPSLRPGMFETAWRRLRDVCRRAGRLPTPRT